MKKAPRLQGDRFWSRARVASFERGEVDCYGESAILISVTGVRA